MCTPVYRVVVLTDAARSIGEPRGTSASTSAMPDAHADRAARRRERLRDLDLVEVPRLVVVDRRPGQRAEIRLRPRRDRSPGSCLERRRQLGAKPVGLDHAPRDGDHVDVVCRSAHRSYLHMIAIFATIDAFAQRLMVRARPRRRLDREPLLSRAVVLALAVRRSSCVLTCSLPFSVFSRCRSAPALPSCVIGAPPGFSEGNSWTLPLVDPLSRRPAPHRDRCSTARGPFLFAIDPDAHFTTADRAIAGIVGIPAQGRWARARRGRPHAPDVVRAAAQREDGLPRDQPLAVWPRRQWQLRRRRPPDLGRDRARRDRGLARVHARSRSRRRVRITVNNKFRRPPARRPSPYEKLDRRPRIRLAALPGNRNGRRCRDRHAADHAIHREGRRRRPAGALAPRPRRRAEPARRAEVGRGEAAAGRLDDGPDRRGRDAPQGDAGRHRRSRSSSPGEDGTPVARARASASCRSTTSVGGPARSTARSASTSSAPYIVSADWQHRGVLPRSAPGDLPGGEGAAPRRAGAPPSSDKLCKVPGCASASAISDRPTCRAGEMQGMAADGQGPRRRAGARGQPRGDLARRARPDDERPRTSSSCSAATSAGWPGAAGGVPRSLDAGTAQFNAPIEPRLRADAHVRGRRPCRRFPRQCANHAPACMHLAGPLAP